MALAAERLGIRDLFVPAENAAKYAAYERTADLIRDVPRDACLGLFPKIGKQIPDKTALFLHGMTYLRLSRSLLLLVLSYF